MSAAEIAKKLTPTQKRAMTAMRGPYAASGSIATSGVLCRRGLITYDGYVAPLSPFGLEVRAILEKEQAT